MISASNDLGRGIVRVLDDQNGYYLITMFLRVDFSAIRRKMPFHKISVKVKRAGLSVRTRRVFTVLQTRMLAQRLEHQCSN